MHATRFSSSLRFGLLALLSPLALGPGCSGKPKSLIKVTVTAAAPVPGIHHLAVSLINGGMNAGPIPVALPNPPVAIPPDQTFSLVLAPDRAGPVTVAIDAIAGDGTRLATGTGTLTIAAGAEADVTISLGGTQAPDLGGADLASGGPDLAVPDLAVPDLALPDLALPDLVPPCQEAACMCLAATDCAPGQACNTMTHQCEGACGPNHTDCNGGCCDGQQCVPGVDPAKCGLDGKSCTACGPGVPTCASGACTSACVVGMGGATCGTGFCCGMMNTCVAVGDGACGSAGGACMDCAQSMSGPICDVAHGTCGCGKAGDCPAGQACKAGVCGAACDDMDPCNGGCCDSVKHLCTSGTTSAQCALGAATCASCANDVKGAACLTLNGMPSCGCKTPTDCPQFQACDLTTSKCTTNCDAMTPCNGGCCTAAMKGTCVDGKAQGLCGNNGGLCGSCVVGFQMKQTGTTCVPVQGGGTCGCTQNPECPANAANCDLNNKICNFSCSLQAPCVAGCCGGGACKPGSSNTACGATGSACSDCTAAATGHVCYPFANGNGCGCNVATDCASGAACNVATHLCEKVCGDGKHTPCNGGCCDGVNHVCAVGTGAAACGAGGVCSNCKAGTTNTACLIVANTPVCGCAVAGDCAAFQTCNTTTHVCESTCGDPSHTPCSLGCCNPASKTCTGGPSTNGACGANGGTCTVCGADTPKCVNAVCSNACDPPNGINCGVGFACCGGHCGRDSNIACGPSCANCQARLCVKGLVIVPFVCSSGICVCP